MIDIIISDPLTIIVIFTGIIALILSVVFIEYYKKLKDQQVISEVMEVTSRPRKITESKKDRTYEEKRSFDRKTELSKDNYDILIAQVNELVSQMSVLNKNITELTNFIKSLPKTSLSGNEEQIEKLVTTLSQVENVLAATKFSKEDIKEGVFEEINVKLDNILKILSTILQQ